MTVATAASRPVSASPSPTGPRPVVHRTRGRRHGPIVRLVSPSDLGQAIKPFVFLDYIDVGVESAPRFGYHPHSGIATLTLLLEGGFSYEDGTGAAGTMHAGSVEWMQAGGGVWHTGHGIGERINGYQLWLALPPALELSAAQSLYLGPEQFASFGPARVVLGELGGVRSPIPSPSPINYLEVRLEAGEEWLYEPPAGHDVAWIAVHRGAVSTPDTVAAGELAVFAASEAAIRFRATGETAFVLGSAARHPHELVLGHYSVHTDEAALRQGEARIRSLTPGARRPNEA